MSWYLLPVSDIAQLWGLPAMILAIPLLGIVKIICDNIPELQPYGFLIGEVKTTKKVSKE